MVESTVLRVVQQLEAEMNMIDFHEWIERLKKGKPYACSLMQAFDGLMIHKNSAEVAEDFLYLDWQNEWIIRRFSLDTLWKHKKAPTGKWLRGQTSTQEIRGIESCITSLEEFFEEKPDEDVTLKIRKTLQRMDSSYRE